MGREGLEGNSTQNDWLQVDLAEFLASTVDLRIVLFQPEDPFGLASK
jgi:hypothetical protein